MTEKYTEKSYMHTLGLLLIAIGMGLDTIHGLGHHPMKQFTEVLAKFVGINYWVIFFILCIVFDILYYIKFKKKDVFLTVLETFILIVMARFFMYTISDIPFFENNINSYPFRILLFIISLNITSLGIVYLFKSHLSMFAIEQAIVLIQSIKPFKNLGLSQGRALVDLIFFILTVIISIFILGYSNINNYWGTLAVVILGGPFLKIHFVIYNMLHPKDEDLNEEEH